MNKIIRILNNLFRVKGVVVVESFNTAYFCDEVEIIDNKDGTVNMFLKGVEKDC